MSHFHTRPAHFAERDKDPLTQRERQLLNALRASGYEIKALSLSKGRGWVVRGVVKARAA